MRFIKIAIIVNSETINGFKEFLSEISKFKENIKLKKVALDNVDNQFLVRINMDEEYYSKVFSLLVEKNIKIVGESELADYYKIGVKAYQDKQTEESREIIQEIFNQNKDKAKQELIIEKLSQKGRYRDLLQIYTNADDGSYIRKQAAKSLEEAVKIAIETNYVRGLKSKTSVDRCVTELIKISGNRLFKTAQYEKYQFDAGKKAIELCEQYDHMLDDLIVIGNDNNLPNLVCLKAIAAYGKKVFSIPLERTNFAYAIKNMNNKWLNLAYQSYGSKLSDPEKNSFNKIVRHISQERLKRTSY